MKNKNFQNVKTKTAINVEVKKEQSSPVVISNVEVKKEQSSRSNSPVVMSEGSSHNVIYLNSGYFFSVCS